MVLAIQSSPGAKRMGKLLRKFRWPLMLAGVSGGLGLLMSLGLSSAGFG